jgi:predicted DNA-binding transcriptional regulator YafY
VNRIDRLFAIILMLQHQKQVRGQAIAQRFEISLRTVYRDMAALIESGVPVVTIPGRGYELMPGYSLLPLAFRPDEAVGVFLGMQMLLTHTTGQTAKNTQQALERLTVAMPSETRAYAKALAQSIQFYTPPERFDLEHPHLRGSVKAIQNHQVVRLHYQALEKSKDQQASLSTRDIEPRQLSYHQGTWYVSGWCRLSRAERIFRLSRIKSLKVLAETFQPRVKQTPEPNYVTVRLQVANNALPWLLERQHHSFQTMQTFERHTVLIYNIETLEQIIPWILSLGKTVIPLEPSTLVKVIRLELKTMLGQLP